ncbi:MAG TPA: hypothetical protein VNA57_12115 [Acidimicrobiales bacterium]|nr:hypothetical protein [Acidimicrobiales bacterium]
MISDNSKRGLLAMLGVVVAVLTLASAAIACTTYRGKFSVTGSGSSTTANRVGSQSGMNYCATGGDTNVADIQDTSASVSVTVANATTCLSNGSNKLPPTVTGTFLGLNDRIYWIDFNANTTDCMHGSSGNVTLGNITISSTGAGSGTYNFGSAPPLGDGIVCVSDTNFVHGNEVDVNVI